MNNTCFACGTVKNRKSLGFDPNTLKSYCLNPNICNPAERPDVTLFSYENIPSAVKSTFPGEKGETLAKLATKAAGVRLHPYLAMHLVNVAEEYDLQSVNEALLFIVHRDYEAYSEAGVSEDSVDVYENIMSQIKGVPVEVPQPVPTSEEIVAMIAGNPVHAKEEPVEVNEAYSEAQENESAPEPEEKEEAEEDEFTF